MPLHLPCSVGTASNQEYTSKKKTDKNLTMNPPRRKTRTRGADYYNSPSTKWRKPRMTATNRWIKNKEINKNRARYRENPQRSSRIRAKIKKELKQREKGQGQHTDITHREDWEKTPSRDLKIEIESETLNLFSEEEEQEVQEVMWEDRVRNDRWDLLAYHSSGEY